MKSKKSTWLLVGLAVILVAGGAFFWKSRAGAAPIYRTQPADRGAVEVTVSATGTIQPVEKVEVGSQVSGTIAWLGPDFNDRVKKGQVLVQLEPSLFRTAVAQAEANRSRAQAALDEAQRNYNRSKELVARGVVAQVDVDAARAAYDQRRAEVKQAQASLQTARVNLGYTTITSPIDGVVIARAVDKGQTVASAMSTPRLYQIAGDLKRMQVESKIDEADIGRVTPGLTARFTVDAFPDDTFEGTVRQVRLEPLAEQNVVTYTTVIDVANPELKLKPGMTANVTIRIEKKDDVLRVPNAALRFKPADATAGGTRRRARRDSTAGAGGGASAATNPRMGRRGAGEGRDSTGGGRGAWRDSTGGTGAERKPATVYVLGADGKPTAVRVIAGITDGTYTEVVRSRELTAGQAVVVGTVTKPGAQATMAAPPGLGGNAGRGGGGGGRRGF